MDSDMMIQWTEYDLLVGWVDAATLCHPIKPQPRRVREERVRQHAQHNNITCSWGWWPWIWLLYNKTTVRVSGLKKAVLFFKQLVCSELIDGIQWWKRLVPSSAWEKLLKLPAICFLSEKHRYRKYGGPCRHLIWACYSFIWFNHLIMLTTTVVQESKKNHLFLLKLKT